MRTRKHRVLAMVIMPLALAGCAPDAPATNETVQSAPQALDSSSTWMSVTSMLSKRSAHAALRLADGRVLVVGGTTEASEAAEYYDSEKKEWTRITVPDSITMTALGSSCRPAMAQNVDGNVVIVAGNSVIAFDPTNEQWTPNLLQLASETCVPSAITTTDGILILADSLVSPLVSPYFYKSGQVTALPALPTPNMGNWQGFGAIGLDGDRVLVSGGSANSMSVIYDVNQPNSWTTVGSMFYRRSYHALALLPTGDALAVGGNVVTDANEYRNDSAEIFDVDTLQWTPTTSMLNLRDSNHTATSLDSGQVLVIGGSVSSTAELFDYSSTSWTSVESADDARYFDHSSTLLENGNVLVTGGMLNEATNAAAICDALVFSWQPRASLPADGRAMHAATALNDGMLLVLGGAVISKNTYSKSLQDAWLYDPLGDSWTQKENPLSIHEFPTATTLLDGRVLLAGGTQSPFAEIFDPSAATNSWSAVDPSPYSSFGGTSATRLDDGRVLLLGAKNADGSTPEVLLFDPSTNAWSSGPAVPDDVVIGAGHSATLLADGTVLVAGGFPVCPVNMAITGATSTALIFDPTANTWETVGSMLEARGFHSATLLADGRVLVAGGGGQIGNSCVTPLWASVNTSSEYYEPLSKKWSLAGNMTESRTEHRAILLKSDKVLVAGGRRNSQNRTLGTAEIFDPLTGTWTTTSRLRYPRYAHSLTRLDGGVIAVGGIQPYSKDMATVERFPQADIGDACTLDEQCTSAHCADGVCCDTACDSPCLACSKISSENKTLDDGICEDVSGCAPYACTLETGVCETMCASIDDCASGYVCNPDNACIEPLKNASILDEASCAATSSSPTQSNAPPWPSLTLVACAFIWRRRKTRKPQRKL